MDLSELPDLPVRAVLTEVADTLAEHGAAVLVAPPGTGKTTLVPLALAGLTSADPVAGGRVVVAEPRRLAARAAAARMAALLGEPVGRTVGYAVRGDRRTSRHTRVEVVTSGLLVRRVQADPELPGVAAVLLDEVHERHLDADLLLALLLDARAGLRPDLRLLATSATVAAPRLAELLGSAPVLSVAARSHPVEVTHVPPLRAERVEATAARAIRRALAEGAGDVLAFLPGAPEIRRTAALLADLSSTEAPDSPSSRADSGVGGSSGPAGAGSSAAGRGGVDVVPLHGRLPASAQDAALRPGPRRRVVLATAVAESSLTVPGVRAVVDGGLARVPRVDHRRGLAGLVTVRVSAAVADQRAGRAGREGPGRVYRCWPEHEHGTLRRYPEPEVRTADLTALALELACWGTPDGSGLAWWDAPPVGALAAGRAVLTALGALDPTGAVTDRGRRLAGLGLHPRLARALLDGAAAVGARAAAEVVALLDDDALAADPAVEVALARLRAGSSPRWSREVTRLTALLNHPAPAPAPDTAADRHRAAPDAAQPAPAPAPTPAAPRHRREPPHPANHPASRTDPGSPAHHPESRTDGRSRTDPASRTDGGRPAQPGDLGDDALVVGLAHPERVARRRGPGSSVYLMAGGTAVELPPGSALADAEWLAVAVADREPGRGEGRVRLAARADLDLALRVAAPLLTSADEVVWAAGDVRAERVRRLGAIVLERRSLADPDPDAVRAALRVGLAEEGLGLLGWSAESRRLRERLRFLHRALGEPWPAVGDADLLGRADAWLAGARRRADLARVEMGAALRALLPWPAAARLDELAPDRLAVPSGSHVRVNYAEDQPVLAVKVQEVFGWTETPRVADGRVPVLLHLLSPAGRPVAVTGDLASFWRTGYPGVRAELRGRYPKHPWPEDPLTAAPTKRTNRSARST